MTSPKLEIVAEPGKTSFTTRRVVDAPRSLVFDAFTKCEHLKQWMGPQNLTMASCQTDLRVGGRYRFVFRTPRRQRRRLQRRVQGDRTAETDRPDVRVRADSGSAALETLELEESGGTTIIRTTTVHKSVENRDGHVNSGMEAGMTEGYARLDQLLAGLLQQR